jgi:hypothetical protein
MGRKRSYRCDLCESSVKLRYATIGFGLICSVCHKEIQAKNITRRKTKVGEYYFPSSTEVFPKEVVPKISNVTIEEMR